MKNYQLLKLQSELWEIQVWIMWLFSLYAYNTGHGVIGTLVFLYSLLTLVGTLIKAACAVSEEKEEEEKVV